MSQENTSPDIISVIHSRKSVRDYSNRVIEKEKIDTILKAGMAAPTAVNMQPWSFIVIADKATLNTLCDGLPYAKMLSKAGAAIVVCLKAEKAFEGRVEIAVIDGTCASENILLTAESLGLGAVWTAVYPYSDRMEIVKKALNIPDNIIPLNVIPIGYPAGMEKPVNKFKPENIHWGKW